MGTKNHINSRWLLGNKSTLDRAILTSTVKPYLRCLRSSGVELNMPPMDGAQWLALFQRGAATDVSSGIVSRSSITLRTPTLTMAGQSWNNASPVSPARCGWNEDW